MYERLEEHKLNVDHKIIFVNNSRPTILEEEVIRAISRNDHTVPGISHSRNLARRPPSERHGDFEKELMLLDGDLQDPPELIETMVSKWREGYET